MQGGVSGFHNAPVARAFAFACGLFSLLVGFQGRFRSIGFSLDLIKNFRIWRLIASIFAFRSTPELFFGLYLLYYFRVFERQLGSNKYSVFVLFSVTFSSLLEVLILTLTEGLNSIVLSSGPYGVIFASFVLFFVDIPVTSRFNVFGLLFSDKSFIYLAGLQLLLSSWKRSLIPGICGLLVGCLYRINAFGIRNLKNPEIIASFFSRIFPPSSPRSSRRPSQNITRPAPTRGSQIQNQRAAQFAPPVAEPPESSIAMLMSMGFDSNAARQALIRARNDINVATNFLLESQSQ